MKKLLIIIMCLIISVIITGCGSGDNSFTELECETPTGIDIYEWISPDGVHYWTTSQFYALSPRYDRNGQIMIDD